MKKKAARSRALRRPVKQPTQTAPAPKAVLEICFYRSNDKPHGAFSNLYRRPILFEGVAYPTAEHAYQAGKARKPEVRDWLLSAPTPALVAMAAHGLYTWDIAPKWAQMKFDRMRGVLRAKFTQHDDLRRLLLSTNGAILVEASSTDNAVNRLWGRVNGKGKNMLGVLLMEVRSELLQASGPTVTALGVIAPRRASKSSRNRLNSASP